MAAAAAAETRLFWQNYRQEPREEERFRPFECVGYHCLRFRTREASAETTAWAAAAAEVSSYAEVAIWEAE